jgi:hypothetical protein
LNVGAAVGVAHYYAATRLPPFGGLTAATAGLAAAAAAATLLNFCHPFDAASTDIVVHALAVGLVIAGNRALSGRLLATNFHAAM